MMIREEQDRFNELMGNIAADAERAMLESKKLHESIPVHYGFKKERKCNNSKRPKPRKKSR